MIVFAHLSDIHLDLGEDAWERAGRVLRYLDDLPGTVDAVLVTGDLADHGLPAEYEQVAKVLAGHAAPVLICPGNHDVREAYREGLLDEPAVGGPINRAHEVAGATFLMCDSTIPGRDDGLLSDETLDWIDATIAHHRKGYICVAAVHTVMASQEDPELRAAVLKADFTVPDGQPLIWAMNALGHDLY